MSKPVVVEYFEDRYGFEENRFFGLFTSKASWENYCQHNGITIRRPDGVFSLRDHYNDGTYTYNANEVDFIQ